MVGTLLWLSHLEACPMRAPSSTAWPTKCLISQEEMWGNLRVGCDFCNVLAVLAAARQHYPLAGSKCRRTIHRFDSANNVCTCAVFLARPR
ncbi:hypothetical protein BRN52_16620 [Xanthomonas oryzae pv. oryzae]|nr:hypothetical protein BRN52_16620 [Xanthomonas oryzae pv. oryzae]